MQNHDDGDTPTAGRAPAVPIGESVQRDFLVCLEDGRPMKMLKRHLRQAHGLTPSQYRAKWGLPPDYPMVAPAYAEAVRDAAVTVRVPRPAGDGGDVVWLWREAPRDDEDGDKGDERG